MELDSVRRLKAQIEERREVLETLKSATINIFRLDGLPRAKAQTSPTEKIASAIVDAELELSELVALLDSTAAELMKAITSKVKGLRGRVLILRYVACMKFADVADALKLSQARTYQLHSEGKKIFVTRSNQNDSDRN